MKARESLFIQFMDIVIKVVTLIITFPIIEVFAVASGIRMCIDNKP